MDRRKFIRNSTITAGILFIPGNFSNPTYRKDDKFKKVVLIGDSIRIGYQPVVMKKLKSLAEVWGPEVNGGTSSNVIKNLHYWVKEQAPDIVHINAGLHDLRTLYYNSGPGVNVIPLDHYRDNIRTIFDYVKTRTDARLIWATTTPVIYEKAHEAHTGSADFDRYNEDVIAYNRAALKIAAKMNVPVNDLYQLVMSATPEKIIRNDGVHFTEEGNEMLGNQVAQMITGFIHS
jgi:lysophospholipase L1-like esterase